MNDLAFTITSMQPEDWPAVQAIYAAGIDSGHATFETAVPTWERWHAGHHEPCRLVARMGDVTLGWAALSPVSRRAVYQGVAEVSVYVATEAWGRGVGKALLQALVTASEDAGFWTLQASIFPENEASLNIHRQCGFRVMGHRERIARHHNIWRDTILMERRSQITGR